MYYPVSQTFSVPNQMHYANPTGYNFGVPAYPPQWLANQAASFDLTQRVQVPNAAAATGPRVKLTYFDMMGRAEPIRLALFFGGIAFEDDRLTVQDWITSVKQTARFGQIPLLEVGGKVLAQAYAQLIFVGEMAGLYPEGSWERAKVNEALFLAEDIVQAFMPHLREHDAEKKKELRAKFEEELPRYLGYVEKLLSETNTGYLAGPRLTIADLNMWVILQSAAAKVLCSEPFNRFARVAEFRERIASLPRVAEWTALQEKAKKEKEHKTTTDMAAAEKAAKEAKHQEAAKEAEKHE